MSKYVYTQRKNQFDISALETPQFVKTYLYHLLVIENKTPKTVLSYFVTVQMLLKWINSGMPNKLTDMPEDTAIENMPIDTIDITEEELSRFITYCGNVLDNGDDAIKNKSAALKSFYRYFSKTNCRLMENPAKLLEMPICNRKTPLFLNDYELYRLRTASYYGQMPERNQCMVAVLSLCGLRLGELVNINLDDISEDKLTVHGEKARVIPLPCPVTEAIEAWLKVRSNYYCIDENAFFISDQKGKRLTERAVQKIIQKIFKRAGFDSEEYSAHTLRHTAAVNMLKNETSDVKEVSKFMGNIASKTISIYKDALERAHA